jgi:hypothetical protein
MKSQQNFGKKTSLKHREIENAVFWDVVPSCKSRRFGGTCRRRYQGRILHSHRSTNFKILNRDPVRRIMLQFYRYSVYGRCVLDGTC